MSKTIRKRIRPEPSGWLLVCAVFTLLIVACNTRIEGCLDVNAENFDLNGERACNDCCSYPSMQLSLTQKWDDRNFSNADTLNDSQFHTYKIADLKYFMTTWSWTDDEATILTVDSVQGNCNNSTLKYTPDILIIDTRQFLYTLGTIRTAPHIVSLDATLGLTVDYSCLDDMDPATPPTVTNKSPLWNTQSGKLETIRLIVQRDLEVETLDTLFIDYTLENVMPYDTLLEKGKDTQLMLTVNYAQWFKDVNVNDLTSFDASLRNNIPGSIIPTP